MSSDASPIPPEIVSLADYGDAARARLDPATAAWLDGGSADELTLDDNVAAFRRLRLNARVLADLAGGHTRLTLLGQHLEFPILVAPVAFQRLLHPDGERATAAAAAAMRAGMVVSAQASVALEEIAARAPAALWLQLALSRGDREFTVALVRRAEAAGCGALVVTVDAPVGGPRNREQRAGFRLPPGIEAVNLRGSRGAAGGSARAGESPLFGSGFLADAPGWSDLAWLRSVTALPLLLKGVMLPADALRALDAGADGIVVSNHGGRVLDTQPATIDALPAVARAVRHRAPVLLDGGIRRGTDVLKALALGAAAVLVGRPCMHGLAVAGAAGVAHVLHLLRTELEMAMAQAGCATLADAGPELVRDQAAGSASS